VLDDVIEVKGTVPKPELEEICHRVSSLGQTMEDA
jgi:hypothetical protein